MFWVYFIITWIFVRIFYPAVVLNHNNLKNVKDGGIIVCNHLSNLDAVYLAHYLHKHFRFLSKKELFYGLKGVFFKSIKAIPVDRSKQDISAIKQCLKVLKQKKFLVIFPEGTRNKIDENLQEIKNGASMLAIKSQVPIVPINIEKKAKMFHLNKIAIGTPFELSTFYNQKLTSETLNLASQVVTQNMKLK